MGIRAGLRSWDLPAILVPIMQNLNEFDAQLAAENKSCRGLTITIAKTVVPGSLGESKHRVPQNVTGKY